MLLSRPIRFGANYVPSAGWFHSWLDPSPDTYRRDFEDLAGIGLDHVRVFPVWPWIQPNRALIRRRGVDDVLALIDVAAEFGLSVAVDLLQGHLSSFDFLPSWVLTWHRRSVFTDRDVRDGIAAYADTLTRAVASRDNVFAVTLGNEVNNLYPANPTTPQESRSWAAELIDVVRAAAPGLLSLHSLYDATWYDPGHPFHPADNVDLGDLTTVHSWVFNGVSQIDGPLGPATVTHADYLVELAAATALDPARPVWLQEIGVPLPDVPGADAAEFVRRTLDAVTANPALWGVTWWCSHDLDRSLADYPEREYDLGLFTVDHRPKPAAKELEAVIGEARRAAGTSHATGTGRAAETGLIAGTGRAAETGLIAGTGRAAETGRIAGTGRAAVGRRALRCPVDLRTQPERRAEVAPGGPFHTEWVRLRQAGPLAIVAGDRADDAPHLRTRGIDAVVTQA